jgi:hypothetical protein
MNILAKLLLFPAIIVIFYVGVVMFLLGDSKEAKKQ